MVAPNTPNTRGGTWLIKWLNDKFPSLVAIIYIQWIGAIMNLMKKPPELRKVPSFPWPRRGVAWLGPLDDSAPPGFGPQWHRWLSSSC